MSKPWSLIVLALLLAGSLIPLSRCTSPEPARVEPAPRPHAIADAPAPSRAERPELQSLGTPLDERVPDDLAATEVGDPPPGPEPAGVPYDHDWAAYHPLAARNARHRAGRLPGHHQGFLTAENASVRRSKAWATAKLAVYTILDHERASTYMEEGGGVMLTPKEGYSIWGNGGAAYEVPLGRFPVFDALEDRSLVALSEAQEQELQALYEQAMELLEPYAQ